MPPGSSANSADHEGSTLPLNHDPDDDNVPENILAFRTITTLLSWLPRRKPIAPSDYFYNLVEHSNDRHALKISDAFAQCVAVSASDVATVTTNRTYDERTRVTALQIMVCVNSPRAEEGGVGRSETSLHSHPTIIAPEPPLDLGERHALVYMKDLLETWKKPSLADHLWILSNVLGPGTGQTPKKQRPEASRQHITTALTKYILAASHHKIARRVNGRLSKAYIESLRQVRNIPPVSPSGSGIMSKKTGTPIKDAIFLICFLKDDLAKSPERYQFSVANIAKAIDALPDNPTNNQVNALQLYTDEMAAEFHQVLLALLDRFTSALDALVQWHTQDEATQGTEAAQQAFIKHLTEAYRVGNALVWLLKGRALKMHLENISGLLRDPRRGSLSGIADGRHDAELEALVGDVPATGIFYSESAGEALVGSHMVWLWYIVSHIDAVEVLVEYTHTPKLFSYDVVSVEALLIPPVSAPAPLLPWSALFDNEQQYIPDDSWYGLIGAYIRDRGGNKELKKIIEEGVVMAEKGVRDTEDLRAASRDWEESQAPTSCATLRNYLEGLVSSNNDKEVKRYAEAIVNKLAHWTKLAGTTPDSDRDRSQIAREVTREVKAFHDILLGEPELSEYHRFFFRLRDMSKTKFTGTLHSEVCLASLLPAFTSGAMPVPDNAQYLKIAPNMQDFNERRIGVSGRCCPTCTQFLWTLNNTSEGRPLVRGQHCTLSACTLPPWTPSNVVKKMNDYFGLRLRFDLQGFMSNYREVRNRREESSEYDSSEGDDGCVST